MKDPHYSHLLNLESGVQLRSILVHLSWSFKMVTFVVCLVICSLSFCQSEIIQKHYKSETSEASSSWQSMVYSARPDINTRIACAALCLSEDANCDGFVYQNQVCHLSQLGGNFNVVSGSTTAANVYIKEGNASD